MRPFPRFSIASRFSGLSFGIPMSLNLTWAKVSDSFVATIRQNLGK